eukprot:Gregarina_sp_Poly_1__6143@NODE_3246_length_1242_cov_1099_241702_g2061_i0_p1_GENE_NODE_3246_length_1242_cov_1099_241702_g2061_i0NODE_3246_length_1242_cov_1099_241702_g2061_i0_p1_ORF_typecomplete_len246_score26_24Alpha_GJ/PF03229_13/0_072_NODE_3246_length_1242_cov_1099_241702_g2061_i03161053
MIFAFPILVLSVVSAAPLSVEFGAATCDQCCGACSALSDWDSVVACQKVVATNCSIRVTWKIQSENCVLADQGITLLGTGGELQFNGHVLEVPKVNLRWGKILPENGCDKMGQGLTANAVFTANECSVGDQTTVPEAKDLYANDVFGPVLTSQGIIFKMEKAEPLTRCVVDLSSLSITAEETIMGAAVEDTSEPSSEAPTEVGSSEPAIQASTEGEASIPEPEAAAPVTNIVSGVVSLCAAYLLA